MHIKNNLIFLLMKIYRGGRVYFNEAGVNSKETIILFWPYLFFEQAISWLNLLVLGFIDQKYYLGLLNCLMPSIEINDFDAFQYLFEKIFDIKLSD